MEPTQDLIDQLWRDKVEAAKRTPPEVKLRAGGDLYDDMIKRMLAGIRWQFPDKSEDEVLVELRRRLDITKALEDRPWGEGQ